MTQDQLDEAYRDAERLKFATMFQRSLNDVLGINLTAADFLASDEIRRLHTLFFRRFRDAGVHKSFWEPLHLSGIARGIVTGDLPSDREVRSDELWSLLTELSTGLGERPLILFYYHERELGAVRLSGSAALKLVGRLWPLVKYDFCLASEGATDGLCLEFNQYSDRTVYELSCWGALVPDALR